MDLMIGIAGYVLGFITNLIIFSYLKSLTLKELEREIND